MTSTTIRKTTARSALGLALISALGVALAPAATAAPGDWTSPGNFQIERDARGERPEGAQMGVEGARGLLAVSPYCGGQAIAQVVLSDSHVTVLADGTEVPRQVYDVDSWSLKPYVQPEGHGALTAQMADGSTVPLWSTSVPGTDSPIRTPDDLRPWVTGGVVGENTSTGSYIGAGESYGAVTTSSSADVWDRSFQIHAERLIVPAGAETLIFTYEVGGDGVTKILQVPEGWDAPCEGAPVIPEPEPEAPADPEVPVTPEPAPEPVEEIPLPEPAPVEVVPAPQPVPDAAEEPAALPEAPEVAPVVPVASEPVQAPRVPSITIQTDLPPEAGRSYAAPAAAGATLAALAAATVLVRRRRHGA